MSARPKLQALVRVTIPRGWVEAWLWTTLLAAFLDATGCPVDGAFEFCAAFSDTVGGLFFTLLPGQSVLLFSAAGLALWPSFAGAALVTAASHLAARRYLPQRVSVVAVISIFVTSLVLTFLATLVWVASVGHIAPWLVLRGMFAR